MKIKSFKKMILVAVLFVNLSVYSQDYIRNTDSLWNFHPQDAWEIKHDGGETILTVKPGGPNVSYNAVLDLSGKVDLKANSELTLSGWVNAQSDAYLRDDVAVIALVGSNGYRQHLRKFTSGGKWVYLEGSFVIPENISNLRLILYGRIWPSVISFKSLSLSPRRTDTQVFNFESEQQASDSEWLFNDRKYRLIGEVNDPGVNQPLWVDIDFARLMLLSGNRDPIDPSSLIVVGIDNKGQLNKTAVSFDKPLSNLSDHYKRNGTLKWRTLPNCKSYEIYFDASPQDGAKPLILESPLGVGELLNYAKDAKSPAWAGWPGMWLDVKDVDGNGSYDIYAHNTDAGTWLLRNIGDNENPLFLSRQKPLSTDKLPVYLPEKHIDWNNDGEYEYAAVKKHSRGGYVEGMWGNVIIKFNDGQQKSLTDENGKEIIFDNVTWTELACGDFNGNGLTDIVLGTSNSDLQFLLNRSCDEFPMAVERYSKKFDVFCSNPYDSGDMSLKPFVLDWNKDGRDDIIFTGWSGHIYLMLNKNLQGKAEFEKPVQLRQLSGNLTVADSPTPDVVDWDGDGVLDIICGDVNGYITFFKNIGTNQSPSFAYGGRLENDRGEPIRITPAEAGGTIQGAVEKWWGYLSVQAVDVNNNGVLDLIINDSLGRLRWIENLGTRYEPVLSRVIRPFLVNSLPLITPWRNRPGIADWNGDGVKAITLLNFSGEIVRYKINPDQPDYLVEMGSILDTDGLPVKIFNENLPNRSKGRSQIDTADWTGDGMVDVLIGRPRGAMGGGNMLLLKNIGTIENPVLQKDVLKARGLRFVEWTGSDGHDQWHSGGPCIIDFGSNGKMDLIHGCESGRLSYYKNDYFLGESYPVFEFVKFEVLNVGKPKVVLDFINDINDATESLVPAKYPIQWLEDELQTRDDIAQRRAEIISPIADSVVSGEVVFEAVAFGKGINKVDFYVDDEWIAVEGVPPYVAHGDDNTWDTTTVKNGRRKLKVVVFYLDGGSVESIVQVIVDN